MLAETAADAAGGPPATDLDTIEVIGKVDYGYVQKRSTSATKTDTDLQDVPQSITVITQDLIKDQAMQNLADVIRYVPGATMAQGEGNRDTPVLRGNSSTADMFVDGMRDDTQYFRDLYNIERVEVLKGPNAMIFGRGGTGGVINRVSKQADWETVRDLDLQLGSWNKRRVAGDFGQAISDDAAFRVTGMFEDSESYRDDYEARALGHQPDLCVRPGREHRVTLGYEHFEDERVADRGVPSSPARAVRSTDPSTFFGDPDRSPVTADVDAFTALVDHDFGNGLTLRNRTRIADYDKFYQNVYAGGAISFAGGRGRHLAPTTTPPSARTSSTRPISLDVERCDQAHAAVRRRVGPPGNRQPAQDRLLPVRRVRRAPRAASRSRIRATPARWSSARLPSDADNHTVADVAAVYVQDQIEFSPQWQAILGLRYDRFVVDFRNNRNGMTISQPTTCFAAGGPGLQAVRTAVALRELQHDLPAAPGRADDLADRQQPRLRSGRVHATTKSAPSGKSRTACP